MVILTQALGHPKRKGLAKTQRPPLVDLQSRREREAAHLDHLARTYLEDRGVWDIPEKSIW